VGSLQAVYANHKVNINACSHSRSKSLLMVFGARVVIARQPRMVDAGINTLRCKLGNEKKKLPTMLLSYLSWIFFRCFGFFFGRMISNTPSLRSALTSSYLISSGSVIVL
jgi:hypothetical protein